MRRSSVQPLRGSWARSWQGRRTVLRKVAEQRDAFDDGELDGG
jgi:hypothetical protein